MKRLGFMVVAAIAVAALAVLPLSGAPYWTTFVFSVLIAYVLAQSWDWVAGEMGYINLGHYIFYGIGAYAFSIALTSAAIGSVPVSMLIAVVVVGIAAVLLGLPLFRLRGDYFAFATLALLPLAEVLTNNMAWLTGGADGVVLPVDHVLTIAFWLALALAVTSFVATLAINRARFGFALRGIRNDEEVAEVMGLPLLPTKIKALLLSSLFAGLAGAIQAWQMSYIDAVTVFGLNVALVPIAMALLGGSGLRWGPFVGVVLLAGIQQWLLVSITMLQATVYGAIILLIGRYMPGGILRAGLLQNIPWLASLTREHGAFVADTVVGYVAPPVASGGKIEMPLECISIARDAPPLLVCKNVVKAFGGNRALAGVSFSVAPGEIVGLVGQNGSGKTTLFNCISKVHSLTGGEISLGGRDLAGLRRDEMAGQGVGRTYQIPRPFGDLTVAENVALSLMLGPQHEAPGRALTEARSFLAYADLDHRHDVRADTLSLQEKKLLEFARALAMRPKLLLIDEIASGLTTIEVARFAERIRAVRDDYGITVIWVEHIVSALNAVADRIVVLEQGQLIANGPPAEVFSDKRVLASYLGNTAEVMQ